MTNWRIMCNDLTFLAGFGCIREGDGIAHLQHNLPWSAKVLIENERFMIQAAYTCSRRTYSHISFNNKTFGVKRCTKGCQVREALQAMLRSRQSLWREQGSLLYCWQWLHFLNVYMANCPPSHEQEWSRWCTAKKPPKLPPCPHPQVKHSGRHARWACTIRQSSGDLGWLTNLKSCKTIGSSDSMLHLCKLASSVKTLARSACRSSGQAVGCGWLRPRIACPCSQHSLGRFSGAPSTPTPATRTLQAFLTSLSMKLTKV